MPTSINKTARGQGDRTCRRCNEVKFLDTASAREAATTAGDVRGSTTRPFFEHNPVLGGSLLLLFCMKERLRRTRTTPMLINESTAVLNRS